MNLTLPAAASEPPPETCCCACPFSPRAPATSGRIAVGDAGDTGVTEFLDRLLSEPKDSRQENVEPPSRGEAAPPAALTAAPGDTQGTS